MTPADKKRVELSTKFKHALIKLMDNHQEEFEGLLGVQLWQTCGSAHQEPGSPIPRSEMDVTFLNEKTKTYDKNAIKITIETIHSRDAIIR